MKKLFLLDAYALIYRSYYAFIKNPRINSKGLNTSAIMGFVNTLNEVINKEGFYTQKFGKPIWDDDVTGGRWANNFIKGDKGLLLFGFIIRAIDEYYRYMDKSIEYFMTDYMIEIAYNTFDEVRNEVDMCAVNNPEALFFNANGSRIYDESVWKDIVKDTWLFNLNYRIPYRSVNVIGEPTYYGSIIK